MQTQGNLSGLWLSWWWRFEEKGLACAQGRAGDANRDAAVTPDIGLRTWDFVPCLYKKRIIPT
jgi:hypothetical protein